MKKIISFIAILFFFQQIYSSNNNDKLNLLLSEYITNIIEYSQIQNSTGAFVKLNLLFTDPSKDHENDLFGYQRKSELMSYLHAIKTKFNHQLIIKIENEQILSCERRFQDKTFRFGTFTKTIIFGNKTNIIDVLVKIDVSNTNYKIDGVYMKLKDIEEKLLGECSIKLEKNIIDEEKKLQSFIKSHFDKATKLYEQKKYIEALNIFKEILVLDKTHQSAIDGVNACKKLISTSEKQKTINQFIKQEKFKKALEVLNSESRPNIAFGRDWVSKINKKCKKGIKEKELKQLLANGNYFLSNGQFRKARRYFEQALKLYPNNQSIIDKVIEAREGDPYFVKRQLKLAYNNAVKSKKNYLSTFRTYKKYENSNLLKGDQYLFMMLMMLDKYKKVAKPMGYTKELAKHLSREYFYKTKRTGYDVSYYENQIFTKSIEKRN